MHKAIDLRTGAQIIYLTLRPFKWFNQKLGGEEFQIKMQLLQKKSTVILCRWKKITCGWNIETGVSAVSTGSLILSMSAFPAATDYPPLQMLTDCWLPDICIYNSFPSIWSYTYKWTTSKTMVPYDPPHLDAFYVSQTYRSTDISADLFLPTFGDLIAKK